MNSQFQAYIEAITGDLEECGTGTTVDRSDRYMPSSWRSEPPMLRPTDRHRQGAGSPSSWPGDAIAYHGLA